MSATDGNKTRLWSLDAFRGLDMASASAMLGMSTGDFIRRTDLSGNRKTVWMLVGAAGLLVFS